MKHDNASDIAQEKDVQVFLYKKLEVQEDVEKETKDQATKSMKTLEFSLSFFTKIQEDEKTMFQKRKRNYSRVKDKIW